MKILIVCGMPGAGKEEFLNVATSMDVPFIRMGDVVREFYKASGAEKEGLTVGQVANREREIHGQDIWARRSIEKMTGDLFLIDGCRSMAEVESFRRLSEDVVIVGIHAPPKARYERLVKRGRDDAPRNMDEFEERDDREIGWGLAEAIARADIMLVNDSDLDSFHSIAKKRLEELR